MSILHLVRKSAFETSDFELCVNTLNSSDRLVLLDDGCYSLHHPLINSVKNSINVLQSHAQARAITLTTNAQYITMDDLIELTFKHNSMVTWQ